MSKKTNNLTPKTLALLFAIFLWTYVMGIENPEITKYVRSVDVVLQNTAEIKRRGLVVMEPDEFKVNVEIIGKKSEVDKIRSKNIVAYADLSGYGEGQQKVTVKANLQDTSANVRIVGSEPGQIVVNFDRLVSINEVVKVVTEGELDSNYILDDISTKPETILISGPKSWVNEVAEARVLVNMTGRTSSTSLTLPILLVNDQGEEVRGVDKDPTMVDVNISILKKKTLDIKLETSGELPDNYNINELKVSPGTVTVKGDETLDSLQHINTKPIDIAKLINGEISEIELDLPENVELLNPDEKFTIKYNIEQIDEKEIDLNFSDLEFRNLNDKLEIEEKDFPFKINLKGIKKELDSINRANIKVFLDLKDLAEGRHELAINLEKPDKLTLLSIAPEKIEINLIPKEEEEEE